MSPHRFPTRILRPSTSLWEDVLKHLLLSLVVILVVVVFLVQPVRVEGTSMEPQLVDQERVFVNKFSYRVFNIDRGDVVVFNYPGDVSKSFIKRVIGLPGETLQIIRGQVFINGKQIPEPYIPPRYQDHGSFGPIRIPPDHFFVMGDHRSVSNDSRHWGLLPRRYIFGKAMLKYWPPEDIGLVE